MEKLTLELMCSSLISRISFTWKGASGSSVLDILKDCPRLEAFDIALGESVGGRDETEKRVLMDDQRIECKYQSIRESYYMRLLN